LEHDHQEGDANQPQAAKLGQPAGALVFEVRPVGRQHNDNGELGKLRRLNRARAYPDPALRPARYLPDDQDPGQNHHGAQIERPHNPREGAVVQHHHRGHGNQPDGDIDDMAGEQHLERRPEGSHSFERGAVDAEQADAQQHQNAEQQEEMNITPDAAFHGSSFSYPYPFVSSITYQTMGTRSLPETPTPTIRRIQKNQKKYGTKLRHGQAMLATAHIPHLAAASGYRKTPVSSSAGMTRG
jgi:hypothetical protein